MANENKNRKTEAAVTYRDGKWVTADGQCFNTADKAWNHVRETAKEPAVAEAKAEAKAETETKPKNQSNGKVK